MSAVQRHRCLPRTAGDSLHSASLWCSASCGDRHDGAGSWNGIARYLKTPAVVAVWRMPAGLPPLRQLMGPRLPLNLVDELAMAVHTFKFALALDTVGRIGLCL